MGSIHEVIDAFRREPSNSERGTKFEQLTLRYFQLDPMLAQQYDCVCRWIDWPERDGKVENGIDLVARTRDTVSTPRSSASSTSPRPRWPRATSTRS